MLGISFKRLSALTKLKFKTMMSTNTMIAPLFSLAFAGIIKIAFSQGGGNEEQAIIQAINMGLLLNVGMTGIFVPAMMLAEEKENHTLRSLMTSSVTSIEFFLASLLPPLIIMIAVNILVLPISGQGISGAWILPYLAITTIASITGCIMGMVLGIYAKNQTSASTITMPFILIISVVPTFSAMFPVLKKIQAYLFTGALSDMTNSFVTSQNIKLNGFNTMVLIGEIILVFVIFIFIYRQNGFEKE